MTVLPKIEAFAADLTAIRQDFHAHPELLFDTHRTAARVAELLGEFGADEVVTGWPMATVVRGHLVMRDAEVLGSPIGTTLTFTR